MSTQRIQTASLVTIFTIGGLVLAGAQSVHPKNDTYTWNAEFVSVDMNAKTMTPVVSGDDVLTRAPESTVS
jgi:hypothetical protein